MTAALQALRIKEAETTGALAAVVSFILTCHDHNLEVTEKDWTRLRWAYEEREIAFNAVTDLLCGGSHG